MEVVLPSHALDYRHLILKYVQVKVFVLDQINAVAPLGMLVLSASSLIVLEFLETPVPLVDVHIVAIALLLMFVNVIQNMEGHIVNIHTAIRFLPIHLTFVPVMEIAHLQIIVIAKMDILKQIVPFLCVSVFQRMFLLSVLIMEPAFHLISVNAPWDMLF